MVLWKMDNHYGMAADCKLNDTTKRVIRADSDSTPIIQEMHIAIGHMISNIVEDLVSDEQVR